MSHQEDGENGRLFPIQGDNHRGVGKLPHDDGLSFWDEVLGSLEDVEHFRANLDGDMLVWVVREVGYQCIGNPLEAVCGGELVHGLLISWPFIWRAAYRRVGTPRMATEFFLVVREAMGVEWNDRLA